MSGEQPFTPQEEEWFNKGEAKAQDAASEIRATDNETKKTDNEVDEEKWFDKAA